MVLALGKYMMMKFPVLLIFSLAIPLLGSVPEMEHFKELTTEVVKIKIRTGGLCHRIKSDEKLVLKTKDPEEISRILGLIDLKHTPRIEQEGEYWIERLNCMCCGDLTILARKKNGEKFEFSIHHDSHIRSKQLNDGNDVDLTDTSRVKWKSFATSLNKDQPNVAVEKPPIANN